MLIVNNLDIPVTQYMTMIHTLYGYGADLGQADHTGDDPLTFAVKHNKLELVQWIAETVCSWERQSRGLLNLAVIGQHYDMIQLLIRLGVDPQTPDAHGEPSCITAIKNRFVEPFMIRFLVFCFHVPINQVDHMTGLTPLEIAYQEGHMEKVQALRDCGAILPLPNTIVASPDPEISTHPDCSKPRCR